MAIARFYRRNMSIAIHATCLSYRHNYLDLDPTYKANRPPRDSAAYVQLDRVKKTLAADGLLLWEAEGFEADDVLATACRAAVKADHNVAIVSADKDLVQLVQHGVTWLSPKTGECLDRAGVRAKFGVWPEQIRDYLAIVGDRSDNVRGVQGIGEKGAAKLLGEFVTLEQLMSAVVTAPAKVATPKVCAALRDALAWLPTTVKLVTLRYDAPIEFKQIYQKREAKTKAEPMSEEDLDPPHEPSEPEAPLVESEPVTDPEVRAAAPQVQSIVREPQAPQHALAVVPPAWELGLEPTSLGAALQLAKGMWTSGLYKRFGSAEAIWAVIIRGRELGMGALTSLDLFHVVEGKPTPSAGLLISRAKCHPDVQYLEFVEGDATAATWRGKTRKGEEIVLRYTIEEARKAGMVKPGSNWEKRAPEMLRKTCGVQLGRILAPGALQGLYGNEEMGGVVEHV